jgi:hypothetical protein
LIATSSVVMSAVQTTVATRQATRATTAVRAVSLIDLQSPFRRGVSVGSRSSLPLDTSAILVTIRPDRFHNKTVSSAHPPYLSYQILDFRRDVAGGLPGVLEEVEQLEQRARALGSTRCVGADLLVHHNAWSRGAQGMISTRSAIARWYRRTPVRPSGARLTLPVYFAHRTIRRSPDPHRDEVFRSRCCLTRNPCRTVRSWKQT